MTEIQIYSLIGCYVACALFTLILSIISLRRSYIDDPDPLSVWLVLIWLAILFTMTVFWPATWVAEWWARR